MQNATHEAKKAAMRLSIFTWYVLVCALHVMFIFILVLDFPFCIHKVVAVFMAASMGLTNFALK
jgi:hypothetical protein